MCAYMYIEYYQQTNLYKRHTSKTVMCSKCQRNMDDVKLNKTGREAKYTDKSCITKRCNRLVIHDAL